MFTAAQLSEISNGIQLVLCRLYMCHQIQCPAGEALCKSLPGHTPLSVLWVCEEEGFDEIQHPRLNRSGTSPDQTLLLNSTKENVS